MSSVEFPPGPWHIVEARVKPLLPSEQSRVQKLLLLLTRRGAKSQRNLNVFTVLARLGPVFPRYLLFFSNLLLKGGISRVDKERIVLRLAWRLGCIYEWTHHVHLAYDLGMTQEEVMSMASMHSDRWDERTKALITATDELLDRRYLTAMTWAQLKPHLSADQLVEFCMFVGHYVMVAMTINSVGIQAESEFLQGASLPPASEQPY